MQLDFTEGPSLSRDGNRYLLTAVCPFSGWTVIAPTGTRAETEVASVLFKRLITVCGC